MAPQSRLNAMAYDRARSKAKYNRQVAAGVCTMCHKTPAEKSRIRCAACKEKDKWDNIQRLYGLTKEQYFMLLSTQGGGCAICGRAYRSMHIDHDHQTNKIRGILCRPCNTALGVFGDCEAGVLNVLSYLQRVS